MERRVLGTRPTLFQVKALLDIHGRFRWRSPRGKSSFFMRRVRACDATRYVALWMTTPYEVYQQRGPDHNTLYCRAEGASACPPLRTRRVKVCVVCACCAAVAPLASHRHQQQSFITQPAACTANIRWNTLGACTKRTMENIAVPFELPGVISVVAASYDMCSANFP